MTTSDPNAAAIIFTNVSVGGNLTIGDVTVTNITQMAQRPPLWANVPRLPVRFVGRDALVDELVRLLRGGAPSVAVHGLPGVGKSALAVVLAHHPDLLAHFSDGVLWAGLGPTPDVMSALAAWGDALGVDVTDKPTPELRSQAVGNAIGQQRLLLVIDDAWQIEPAQLLRCGGPQLRPPAHDPRPGPGPRPLPATGSGRSACRRWKTTPPSPCCRAWRPKPARRIPRPRSNWPGRWAACRWRWNLWAASWPRPSAASSRSWEARRWTRWPIPAAGWRWPVSAWARSTAAR